MWYIVLYSCFGLYISSVFTCTAHTDYILFALTYLNLHFKLYCASKLMGGDQIFFFVSHEVISPLPSELLKSKSTSLCCRD